MRFRLAFLAVFISVSMAFAQEASVREVERAPLNEIERGVYFQLQGGVWYLLEAPTYKGAKGPSSLGQSLQIEVGYELGERVALGVILLGTFNPAGSDYYGESANKEVSGGFSSLTPGLSAKVNLVGFEDGQSVKRTWLYARAAFGASFFFPKALLPKADYLVNAGVGVEYYTRLRHFSIGLEASGIGLLRASTFGFAITPSLRYAF